MGLQPPRGAEDQPAVGFRRQDGAVAGPWNVNIHDDGLLDRCVPATATSVLDVGCGDGFLAARLARRVPTVVGLDVDEPVLRRAQQRFPDQRISWRHGDVRDPRLALGRFHAVVSNATLHHLGATDIALRRLRTLVRPGGILAVVAFTAAEWRELPWLGAAFVARGVAIAMHGKWEHTAPQCWPPPDTFRQLRRHAAAALPGARVSRLLMGRCLIRWQAPDSAPNC